MGRSISRAAACGALRGACPLSPAACADCGPELHPECIFAICCADRGVEHCGLCEDFPCAALAEFFPDDDPRCAPGYHIESLRRRAWIGTPAWLWEQGVPPPSGAGAERAVPAAWT